MTQGIFDGFMILDSVRTEFERRARRAIREAVREEQDRIIRLLEQSAELDIYFSPGAAKAIAEAIRKKPNAASES